MPKVKLLTKAIEKILPALYSTEKTSTPEKKVICKFFSPYSNYTWYAVEYSPEEGVFYGLVCGQSKEWGYFSLAELEGLTKMNGKLPLVERDMYFEPCLVKELPEYK